MDSYKKRRDRENRKVSSNNAELATVTSPGQKINAEGIGEYREVPLVAPFGIRWNPPVNANVQLIKNWNNGKSIVAVGTIIDQALESGESEMYSIGGASIKCKVNGEIEINTNGGAKIETQNDGSVVINDALTISKDGTVTAKHFVSTQYGGVSYGL